MTFNNFIKINDGTNTYQYKTALRSWKSVPVTPSTARVLLSGNIDITYGPTNVYTWEGELLVPVTSPGGNWGTISTLRTQLKKKVLFQFTDHYNQTYTTASIEGPFPEHSIAPDWEAASNDILVSIKVMAK